MTMVNHGQETRMIFTLSLLATTFEYVICSMFCCTLLYVHSSIAIILMGVRMSNSRNIRISDGCVYT